MKEAVITLLHKEGDKADCKNYKGFALLDTSYKILEIAIRNRLQTHTENIVGEYQCGRSGYRLSLQVFKEIQAICYQYNIELHATCTL